MLHLDPSLVATVRQASLTCLFGGLGLSALWGLWLLVAPPSARRFAKGADRWVSTDPVVDRLNRPISSHRLFYRYHRVAGSLISLGAAFCLERWAWSYDRVAFLKNLDRHIVSSGMDWMVAAAEWLFVAFNVGILVFGIVVFVRPSLLKAPEKWADRWVQVPGDQALNRRFDPLGAVVDDHPRLVGALVALACGFLLWRLDTLY